jgi:hypothetical protein
MERPQIEAQGHVGLRSASAARPMAMPASIPSDAPVTTATLFVSFFVSFSNPMGVQ